MNFTHPLSRFLAPNIAGAVIGLGVFSIIEKGGEDKERSFGSSQSASTVSAKSQRDLRRSQASEALQLAENGNPQAMGKFFEHWLTLHTEDQDYILGQLSNWYYHDADKYYEFVRDFGLQIFSHNRPLGLRSLSVFPRDERIRNLERHILEQWVSLDQDEILSHLSTIADKSLAVNSSHLYQLASIYGNEHAEGYEDFVSWISELDRESSGLLDLQRSAYEALSHHCPDAHRPELYAHLMEQAESVELFRSFPAILLGQHAIKNPAEATTWLEEMGPGPWKDEALYRFLNSAGEHQPVAGANLMNRERFLSEFAVAWEETEEGGIRASEKEPAPEFYESFYDSALEHFLSNALVTDPDLVFESAEAFYDSELKEDFQIAAKDAAAGGFTPISSPSHDDSCGPNCNHEHH